MRICSNLQWIEFDGSKGCVNSWEFSRSFLKVKVQNGGYFFGLLKFQIFLGGAFEIPDILGRMVDAGTEPTYEEKLGFGAH